MDFSDMEYYQFIKKVKIKIGIDLSLYKENQMKRRLTSFRDKKNFSNFTDFFKAIEKDEQLYTEFLEKITINISEFFRNAQRWKILEDKIIPIILKSTNKKSLKCWSAACSTGEEPYTLSMILNDSFPNISCEILATDLDESALKKAQEGIYAERLLREMPLTYKEKYFKEENKLFHINSAIKKNVKFMKKDLLIDKFDNNFDLIICRNVVIYFTEEAKHVLFKKISDALNPGGVLFVGSTEQVFNSNLHNLNMIDNFFYQKY